MKNEIRNAVIYTRTATTDGFGTESQINTCKEFAEHSGYQVIKVFSDEGAFANNLDRPEFAKMFEYFETHKNEIDAIIVWRLDRLTINNEDYHNNILPFLNKHNIKLLSATENNDETPEGKLMRNIAISLTEYEINSYSKKRNKLSK